MSSTNTDIVIAMDCFRGNETDSVMVKRLAISNVTLGGQASFLFLPEQPWSELNEAARKANSFATRYIHNIPYDAGYVPYDRLHQILMECTENAREVFTKGSQNSKFLTGLLGRPVVDIDSLGLSRDRIKRLKKHVEPVYCLDDHARIHSTAGFDGPTYSCCVERVCLWTLLVDQFRCDQALETEDDEIDEIETMPEEPMDIE
jgi:hypothetical protein